MNRLYVKLLFATFVGLLYVAAPANAAAKNVDCDAGETISNALETSKGNADILEIIVSGQCNEVITIRRDRVWITGDPFAVINGRVRVFSSNNVRFFNLAISGPGVGLLVTGGGDVFTDGVHLVDNGLTGLVVRGNTNVFFRNGMIIGNCEGIEDEECNDGAEIENASLTLMNSSIYNSRYGIAADVGARVILYTTGPRITEVAGNSVAGVQAALHSVVDLRGNTRIHGNGGNGLYALQDSAIRILTPSVTVTDHIFCEDWESSLAIRPEFPPVATNCTGF